MTRGRALTDRERLLRQVSGGQLTRDIVAAARRLGWLAHHSRPGQAGRGHWATQLMGDAGLPDLVLVRPPEVVFVECKRQVGDDLTAPQRRWRDALVACPGVSYLVVRPSEVDDLYRRLAGGQPERAPQRPVAVGGEDALPLSLMGREPL